MTARVTWGNPTPALKNWTACWPTTPFDYLYWQFVADEMYAGDSLDKRKAVLVQLLDKFFAHTDHLYPLSRSWAWCATSSFPTGAAVVCRRHAVPRVHPPAERHAQRRDLPLPGHDVRAPHEDGRRQDQLAQEKSPLQQTANMPCQSCEAYDWCRGNCMKNMYLGCEKNDLRYRTMWSSPFANWSASWAAKSTSATPNLV